MSVLRLAWGEWLATFSLVFGGCCSNAWALEIATAQYPNAGTLITFAQFLLVSAYGLYKHLVFLGKGDAVRWRMVDEILKVYKRKKRFRAVYMAIEGRSVKAIDLADMITHDLRCALTGVNVSLVNEREEERRELVKRELLDCGELLADSYVWQRKRWAAEGVVVVVMDDATKSGARDYWDYVVFLVEGDSPDVGRVRTGLSLTVNIRSAAEPVILQPVEPKRVFSVLKRVRLARRAIPISRWGTQVALFFVTSLLNNAAFGYDVPMRVHIIFRSGGLVANMAVGYVVGGRRYSARQLISVLMVTLGVGCTTLSAARADSRGQRADLETYYVGILLLTLALVMSACMGLAQDRAYEQYGRGHWQEALFYLHVLALPGFALFWRDLIGQVRAVHASARVEVMFGLSIPSFYVPLLVNVATQLVCVSGVHRLTSRANSLTVTLVLVVRKAASLGISVLLNKSGGGLLWIGGGMVLIGTIGYSVR